MAGAQQSPELSELICFDLYAASRAFTGLYRSLLSEHGMTYPQYLVLVVLWRERERTVKQLSDALSLDYGTLTPLLKRLEIKGLIVRERRRDDERSVTVRLTDTGRASEAQLRHIPRRIHGATGLDVDQAAALHGTLRALTESVTAYTANAAPTAAAGVMA